MKLKIGARSVGPKKAEMLSGRSHTSAAKAAFRKGPIARVDANAGRVTPLLPLQQVAAKPARKNKQ